MATPYFTAHRNLEPTQDYGQACSTGTMLAGQFAQYLRDNPLRAGDNRLGLVVESLAKLAEARDGSHGYLVGFCAELEAMILRGAMTCDPIGAAIGTNARYAAIQQRAEEHAAHEVGPKYE